MKMPISAKNTRRATEIISEYGKAEETGTPLEDARAEAYLKHLLNDGANEGISDAELPLPPYYDEHIFVRGQAFLKKYRFVYTLGMMYGLIAVLAIPTILRVLIGTHQSSTSKTAYRRYMRTIFLTLTWYEHSPASKDSVFWSSIAAVRKAHARASKMVSANNAACRITQKDMALTQFGFMGFITVGAERIQLYDDEFLECTTHMWRVLGYLLGIKDEYNICAATWIETKPRLEIVMRRVYAPALANSATEFQTMSRVLIEALWPMNTSVSYESYLYFTKRLARVEGYEYYDFDFSNEHPRRKFEESKSRSVYSQLGWWDRFIVSYGLFIITYLHKYSIVRWYLNLRIWLTLNIMYYFPILAIWQFGWRTAFVRITNNFRSAKENGIKLKYN